MTRTRYIATLLCAALGTLVPLQGHTDPLGVFNTRSVVGSTSTTATNPTPFDCDGTDQTTAISAVLVNGANLLFTGTCKTGNITKNAITATIDFAPGAKLMPIGTPGVDILDVLWKCTRCDLHIKTIIIDGNKVAQNAFYYDAVSAVHSLLVDDAQISNMGSDSLTATNIVTGFRISNYPAGSLVKIGKFTEKDFNSIGNASCGDAIGSVRGIYMDGNGATADIGYFEASGGSNIEDNDYFHSQSNNAGGVIHNFVARYNHNTRRVFKQQSGNWTLLKVDIRPGSDFVSCDTSTGASACGTGFGSGTQVGKYNLNAIDFASTGSGRMEVVSGYVDCTGFGVCIGDSAGGGIITTGPNLTLVGPTAFGTRDATSCNLAMSNSNMLGFYAPPLDIGSGINGTRFINFSVPAALQGKNNFSRNAIFYDPRYEIAELSSSTQKSGIDFSGNITYTVTSGYLNNTRMVRGFNALDVKVSNNVLIEQGNTGHASTFIGFTDANATGIAYNNVAPSGTTNVSIGSSAVVNLDDGQKRNVTGGGTGAATLTGIVVGNGTSALTASALSSGISGALSDETGSGSLVFATAPTITGGSHTGATSFAVAAGNFGFPSYPKQISGNWYVGGLPATTATSTNTTPLVNDTEYAVISTATAPITIQKIGLKTSSSNASASAAVKVCIYAADGTNGAPGTLLGSTTSGTNIGDSAVNTKYSFTLDSPTPVGPGPYYVAFLQTSSTGARFYVGSNTSLQGEYMSTGTSDTALDGSGFIWSYTAARSYASGCVNPFGSTTTNTTVGLAPLFTYQLN